ncbi:hypothetical protein [Egbenema bharatensis]|uniref:hypothetical protein n=1 Tax=Egbenema bharatensis TaxID=3463334 RepID=UPI003A89AB60
MPIPQEGQARCPSHKKGGQDAHPTRTGNPTNLSTPYSPLPTPIPNVHHPLQHPNSP